jgi:hypothetical protein
MEEPGVSTLVSVSLEPESAERRESPERRSGRTEEEPAAAMAG